MGTFGTNRIYTVGQVVKIEDLMRFERFAPRGFDSLRISNTKFINLYMRVPLVCISISCTCIYKCQVWLYVCTYLHMDVSVCVSRYLHIYVYTCLCIYIYEHSQTYEYTHIYTHIYISRCIYVIGAFKSLWWHMKCQRGNIEINLQSTGSHNYRLTQWMISCQQPRACWMGTPCGWRFR